MCVMSGLRNGLGVEFQNFDSELHILGGDSINVMRWKDALKGCKVEALVRLNLTLDLDATLVNCSHLTTFRVVSLQSQCWLWI